MNRSGESGLGFLLTAYGPAEAGGFSATARRSASRRADGEDHRAEGDPRDKGGEQRDDRDRIADGTGRLGGREPYERVSGGRGDVCYNRIHVWLALTNHDARLAWIETIGKIEALAPRIVVAGHKAPSARDDDLAELIAGTRQYIIDFDEAERVSSSREELVGKMLAAHGDRGDPYSLWAAATAAFSAR
jgi:hypothetical protein